jgi:hypothetical protein
MSESLSVVTVSERGIELAAPERKRLFDASLSLLHHANLKDWQSIALRAGAFWNIKTHKLHLEENAEFGYFAESLGYDVRQARRYARIGQRMFELSLELAKERGETIDAMSFTFTQKQIAEVFEGFFTNGHVVTVERLAKASSNLEEFKAYLSGQHDDEGSALKLLTESNVVSEKRLEDPARDRITTTRDFHAHMREIAKEKGLRWNKEKFRFENVDGTLLRDDQRVELATSESGLEVWNQTFKEIRQTKKRLSSIAQNFGDSYLLYDRVPDTNFHTIVTEIARSIKNEIESYEEMLECLLAKDFARMKELSNVRADAELLNREVPQ